MRSTDRERDEWERELLGVSLSSISVLSSVLSMADSEHIVFRSDIDQNLAGQKVSLVGQVSSVTQRFTKNNKPFIIAGLALMDGQIEVFVWEEQMQDSEGVWEMGQTVVVAGTVRAREDQISISCSNAGVFSPDEAEPDVQPQAPAETSPPAAIVSEARDTVSAYNESPSPRPREEPEQKKQSANGAVNGTSTRGTSTQSAPVNGGAPGLAHSRPIVPSQLNPENSGVGRPCQRPDGPGTT